MYLIPDLKRLEMPSRTLALGLALSALNLLPACSRPNPPAENAAGGQEQTDPHTPSATGQAAGSGGVVPQTLLGTTWVLVDIGGTETIEGVQATLEFPEAGKIAGRGSCNRFFGSVQIRGDTIAIGPLGATRMACPATIMRQESQYLQALDQAARYKIDGTSLMVYVNGMDKPLRFMQH